MMSIDVLVLRLFSRLSSMEHLIWLPIILNRTNRMECYEDLFEILHVVQMLRNLIKYPNIIYFYAVFLRVHST